MAVQLLCVKRMLNYNVQIVLSLGEDKRRDCSLEPVRGWNRCRCRAVCTFLPRAFV